MIKVEDEQAQLTIARVYEAGQEGIFRFWDELGREERRSLIEQAERLDFRLLKSVVARCLGGSTPTPGALGRGATGAMEPPEAIGPPTTDEARERQTEARLAGLEAIAQGRVGAIMVAGGQSSRLGIDSPKALFPVGPISGKPLVAFFAEMLRARADRAGVPAIPWYIMTSEATHDALVAAFEQNDWYGVPSDSVLFMKQRELPAVDTRGKVILAEKARIATAPNGHGGLLPALRESGALDDMKSRGLTTIFYFQVDNPLCPVLDPVFIGWHLLRGAEMGTKVVPKTDPEEKVGVVVRRGEALSIVEYSELDETARAARDEDGRLRFRAGNAAIHTFSVAFLERAADLDLPYHAANKKISSVNRKGERVEATKPNGLKFELFLFDAMPHASPAFVQEIERIEEFSPIKNPRGADSPESARRDLISRWSQWIEAAGGVVPRAEDGTPTHPVEISPLTALDRTELVARTSEAPPAVDGELLL